MADQLLAQFLAQRVVLAELSDLDAERCRREACDRLQETPRAVALFESKLAECRRRFCRAAEPPVPPGWPTPIAAVCAGFLAEPGGACFRLVHRLRDVSEVVVKYVATIALADLATAPGLSQTVRDILARSLDVPSLGSWTAYAATAIDGLAASGRTLFAPELLSFAAELKREGDALVGLRNKYAHGATPPDEECLDDLVRHLPHLLALLRAGGFLKRYRLLCRSGASTLEARGAAPVPVELEVPIQDGGVVVINPDDERRLDLLPILTFLRNDRRTIDLFYTYNRRPRSGTLEYLNYDFGEHRKVERLQEFFDRSFPLWSWRQSLGGDESQAFVDGCPSITD